MKKKEVAIEVKNLSKSFRLPTEKSSELKQAFVNFIKGIKGYKDQKVLNGISFTIEKGDFFGIVGRNGSGKSTLLKILAGIYSPDEGTVKINGNLVPFIELGVGFNSELTGRENVYLNGALLGFSKTEVDEMYDEIVKFAELGDFMEQKLKNYSSGMQVRLAFSIAIRAQSSILVLDEVLAVGDEAFQRKCFNYFAELKKYKRTVVLVTHSMDSVQQFCNKAIMIENGRIIEQGNSAKVAQRYRELFIPKESVGQKSELNTVSNKDLSVNAGYSNIDDKLIFDIEIESKVDIEDAVVTLEIFRNSGEQVYRWTSDEKILGRIDFRTNKNPIKLKVEMQNIFPDGGFNLQLCVKKRDRTVTYAMFSELVSFDIITRGSHAADVFWKPVTKVRVSK